jgi:YVTN family beta-propeller protein
VYVTSYDDTVTRIDTATLAIDGSVEVGRDPDGICIKNNKIYVANSGGLDFATKNYDKTVSVINLQNFTVEKTIKVGTNPYQVFADSEGDVYVTTRGNYADIAPTFKKISPNYEVTAINNVQVSEFTIVNDKAYILYNEWEKPSLVKVFDCQTEKVVTENFIVDKTLNVNGYKIAADAYVYVTTTDYITSGNVFCFDKTGKLKFKLESVGMNPNKVIFLN